MPKSIIYRHGDRCRKAAYRERVKREAEAAGVQFTPSLEAVRAASGTKVHDGHAQNGGNHAQKRRSGLQLSYRKTVEVLTAAYAPKGREEESRGFIEATLVQALSPRQRAQVELQRREAA